MLAEPCRAQRVEVIRAVLDLDAEAKRRSRSVLTEETLDRLKLIGVLEGQIIDVAASAKTIRRQGVDVRQEQILHIID
jgi:hypothetical protein